MPGHVTESVGGDGGSTDEAQPRAQVRRLRPTASHSSGRERHDEKITVYVSSEELFAIEQARLVLRAEHGIAADRGRLVREAMAEMLLDLEAHGENSAVVRRLRPS
ncbi:MAG: hypothetical protein QOH75_1300 [Actinomycetota bacterium]|nr:hypothetical protein [Actinomycetota bacterium]